MRNLTRITLSPRFVILVGCFSMALLSTGCGGGTSTVSGQVTLADGTPLQYGKIRVQCLGGRQPVFPGEIQDGKYSFANIPYGEIKFEIETIPPADKLPTTIKEIEPQPGQKEPGPYVRISPKYRTIATSGLSYQVQKSQETFNIKLEPILE